ncbi:MAG: acylphosphatase [Limisphaerales bacterium]|jgi:acylphosphatase
MNRVEMRIIYKGNVQGVGFRWMAKRISCGYEVVGFVRNLPDGSVELVGQGEKSELEEFAQAIRDSGLGPSIRDENMSWTQLSAAAEAQGHQKCYKGFDIA